MSAYRSVTARISAACLIVCCVAATPTAKPKSSYELIDLGTLGGVASAPVDINERGDVTGISNLAIPDPTPRAFRYRNGILEDIGAFTSIPAPQISIPYGINRHGDVVGYSPADPAIYGGPVLHGFLYRNGEMIDVTVRDGIIPAGLALLGINDAGDMIGRLRPSVDVQEGDPRLSRGVILIQQNGAIFDLGTMGSGSSVPTAVGLDINNNGEIVGYVRVSDDEIRGFYYHAGQYEHVTGPPICAALHDAAVGRINDVGQIIGSCSTQGGFRSFVYDTASRSYTELGLSASGLNDFGDIVGSASVPGASHAFLYDNDERQLRDLNALIDAGSGWLYLEAATAINNSGDITGTGRVSNGESHAFLLRKRP